MNYIDSNLVNTSEPGDIFSFVSVFFRNMDRLLRLGGGMPGLGQVSIQLVNILFLILINYWNMRLIMFKTPPPHTKKNPTTEFIIIISDSRDAI